MIYFRLGTCIEAGFRMQVKVYLSSEDIWNTVSSIRGGAWTARNVLGRRYCDDGTAMMLQRLGDGVMRTPRRRCDNDATIMRY